jgi:hypothetical protein
MSYLHFTFKGRQVYVETLCNYGVHGLLLHPLKRFSPQSTYRGRGEIGEGSLSALSARGYTTTLYVMVTIVKGGGHAPPTHTSLGWFYRCDGMYFARTWPLPLYVLFNSLSRQPYVPPFQRTSAAGVVDTGGNLPLVSLTPAATGGKYANTRETGGKICHHCSWYRLQICHWWSTLSCEYFRKFSKKFETALVVYSGAWGKLIHEKNQKRKISWHCPFKGTQDWEFFDLDFGICVISLLVMSNY